MLSSLCPPLPPLPGRPSRSCYSPSLLSPANLHATIIGITGTYCSCQSSCGSSTCAAPCSLHMIGVPLLRVFLPLPMCALHVIGVQVSSVLLPLLGSAYALLIWAHSRPKFCWPRSTRCQQFFYFFFFLLYFPDMSHVWCFGL